MQFGGAREDASVLLWRRAEQAPPTTAPPESALRRPRALCTSRLAMCLLLLCACTVLRVWHGYSQLQAAAGSSSSSPCSRLQGTGAGIRGAAIHGQPGHAHRRLAKTDAREASRGCQQGRRQLSEQRISRIAIIGEQHSGTNLAEQLLAQNLDPARPAPADPAEHAHTLLVVPVRNPYDWVMALRQMCYCCMKMQQLGFADFVQQPYAPDLFKRDAGSGLPCTSDVNIRNRTAFGSVIDMRAAKLRGLFGLGRQLGVPVEVTRLEDMLQPEGQAAFVQQLASKYGLPLVGEAGQAAGSAQPAHVQQPGSGSAAADARRLSEGGAQTARKDPAPPLEPVLVQPRNGTGAGGSPAGRASGVVSPSIVTLQGTDARWFVKRTFTALSRVSSSLYLNEVQLARHWGSLAPGIQALNRQLDWELEEQLGYHPLQQAQQATLDRAAKELEAEREAARRQATYAATVQAARRQSSRLPASKAVVVAGQAGPRVFCGGIPVSKAAGSAPC